MQVFAAASCGRAKMPSGINGARTTRSTRTKPASSATPPTSGPIVDGASQPDSAARVTAKTSPRAPAVTVTAPSRSGRIRSPSRRPEMMTACAIAATTTAMVIDETGLGKSLLYREFPSKDDLVIAWLHQMRAVWWESTGKVIAHYPGDPARQLLGIVEMVRDDVSAKGYFGCV